MAIQMATKKESYTFYFEITKKRYNEFFHWLEEMGNRSRLLFNQTMYYAHQFINYDSDTVSKDKSPINYIEPTLNHCVSQDKSTYKLMSQKGFGGCNFAEMTLAHFCGNISSYLTAKQNHIIYDPELPHSVYTKLMPFYAREILLTHHDDQYFIQLYKPKESKVSKHLCCPIELPIPKHSPKSQQLLSYIYQHQSDVKGEKGKGHKGISIGIIPKLQHYIIHPLDSITTINIPVNGILIHPTVKTFNRKLQKDMVYELISEKWQIEINFVPESKNIAILDQNRILSGDFGMENFLTCITNDPLLPPFILDGKIAKHIVEHCNYHTKQIDAKISQYNPTINLKTGLKYGKHLPSQTRNRITLHKAFSFRNLFHRYWKFLIQYCIKNNIGTIILGYNKGWKQKLRQNKNRETGFCKLNPKTRRIFEGIPYYIFIQMGKYLQKQTSINIIYPEEGLTSQIDNLNGEPFRFNATTRSEVDQQFKRNLKIKAKNGKERKVRGLFRSHIVLNQKSLIINADINGSIGIMRLGLRQINFPTIDFKEMFKNQDFITIDNYQQIIDKQIIPIITTNKYLCRPERIKF